MRERRCSVGRRGRGLDAERRRTPDLDRHPRQIDRARDAHRLEEPRRRTQQRRHAAGRERYVPGTRQRQAGRRRQSVPHPSRHARLHDERHIRARQRVDDDQRTDEDGEQLQRNHDFPLTAAMAETNLMISLFNERYTAFFTHNSLII